MILCVVYFVDGYVRAKEEKKVLQVDRTGVPILAYMYSNLASIRAKPSSRKTHPQALQAPPNPHHSPLTNISVHQLTHNAPPLTHPPDPLSTPTTPLLPRALPGLYKTPLNRSPNCPLLHHPSGILPPRLQPQPRRLRPAQDGRPPTAVRLQGTAPAAGPRPEEEGSGQSRREAWVVGVFQSREDGAEYAGGG